MLVIRLLRIGKKNQPSFKIVVVDKEKSSTCGEFIEEVGFYNSVTGEKSLKADRIKYWISVGAKPLETVHNFLIKEKIIEGKKVKIYQRKKKKEETTAPAVASTTPAVPAAPAVATTPVAPVAPVAPVQEKPAVTEVPKPEAPKVEVPKEENKETTPEA